MAKGLPKLKLVLTALFAVGLVVAYWLIPDTETLLRRAAESEQMFRDYHRQQPLLVYGVAFLIYWIVTGFSLPGAAVMTLAYGWLFGLWRTVILVSFASTAGACTAFLISRYLLRDIVQAKFADFFGRFNRELQRDGAFYLFTLRLIPAVPFFVINIVMGLTPIGVRTFWLVSQVGMLPGTVVFAWAGGSVPSLADLAEKGISSILSIELVIAFVALGCFPLIARKVMTSVQARRAA